VKIIVLCFTFFCTQTVWADCAPMRLDQTPGAFSQIPIHNQESSDLCYAYTASQLVDAWRFSHGDTRTGHHTSAVVAGVYHALDVEERVGGRIRATAGGASLVSGGNIYQLIDTLRSKGSCSHEHIQAISARANSLYVPADGFPDPYQRFMTAIQSSHLSHEYDQLIANFQLSDSRFCPHYIGPGLNPKFIPGILSFLRELSGAEVAVQETCRSQTIDLSTIPRMNGITNQQARANTARGFTGAYTDAVNTRLSRPNPQPVSVSYCVDFLGNKDFRKYSPDGTPRDGCEIGRHLSVIIGRREVAGRCQFLLRNSFGPDCTDRRYDSRWRDSCQQGQFWIDAEAMAQNADEFGWLGE